MRRSILYALLFVFLMAGCGQKEEEAVFAPEPLPEQTEPEPPSEPAPEPEAEPDPREAAIEAVLKSMSLEEKVGQIFFVRCPERKAAEKIAEYHFGGVLLFTRDFQNSGGGWLTVEAFVEKVAGFQEAASVPLLIGVDEEGGTVARASRNPNLFPEKFKSPQEVYANGGLETVARDAAAKSEGLLSYGINVNFAPVADVCVESGDFMYERSFGRDAEATAEFVRTVVMEMDLAGIGSVLKHFPGYGNNADTHTGIAIDERPYSQFLEEDFQPFRTGIEAGAGSVLVSHNIVTCMDENLPASLSGEVHRVLREELEFEGVILTDELAMDAVNGYARDGSAAVLAVLAGNDMIVTTDFEKQIPLVVDAVRTGLIDEEIIDTAVRRVLGWKYDLGLIK